MKQFTSTLSLLFLSIYVWAQAGTLETTTFNPTNGFVVNDLSPTFDDYGNSIAIQSNGRIVVAVVSSENKFKIVRYMPDGTLDPSFGTGGVVTLILTGTSDACQSYAVGLQSSGKIIVGGYSWTNTNKDFALTRLNTNGSVDATFGSSGIVITPISPVGTSAGVDIIRSIAIQSDNSIIAAGYSYNGTDDDFAVAKYDIDGNLVTGFGTSGYTITNITGEDMPNKVAITSTGAIVVAGTSNISGTGTADDYTLVRYTSGGALDVTFNSTGIVTSGITGVDAGYGVAIQSNDYIVITGATPASFGTTDLLVARYKTDGTPDASFGTAGITTTNFGPGASFSNDEGHGIAIQGDGSIVISGTTDGNGSYDFLLARYTSIGGLDPTFGTSATSGITTTSLSAQGDFGLDVALYGTNIYVAGNADYTVSGTRDFAIAAYNNSYNTLPVVLTQFYGQKQTSKVVLQWTTSSEENVAQYIVERSSDGKTYKAIGTVAATGNSSTPKSYSFADQSPFTATNNFYRLQVQDLNGSTTYSKILIIKFSTSLTTNMQVFPNPVKSILQIQIPGGFTGTTSLQVFDVSGHLVKMNSLTSDGNALNTILDVTTLSVGIYTLKATDGSKSITQQFVKQ